MLRPFESPPKPKNEFSNIRNKNVREEEDFNLQKVNKYMIEENNIDRSGGIILSEAQQVWLDQVMNILDNNRLYIDTSEMGSGKTFIVLSLALKLELPLFIICPASIEGVWRTECKNYSIPLAGVIGYQALRSVSGKQPKHGFLTRQDNLIDTGLVNRKGDAIIVNDPEFTITPNFKDLVQKGILLIFDEFQMIKNNTAQFKAAYGLIKGLDSIDSPSRGGLLSATPVDKAKQSINLFFILGMIDNTDPLESVDTVIENCLAIDAKMTKKIVKRHISYPIKKKLDDEDRPVIEELFFELYEMIIKERISGYIEPNREQYTFLGEKIKKDLENLLLDSDEKKILEKQLKKELIINDIQNGYYRLSTEGYQKLKNAVKRLNEAGGFIKEQGGRVVMSKMKGLTIALRDVELAKVEIFCRIGLETLQENDQNKIIFCVNYRRTILSLSNFFKEYEPLKFDGSVHKENRAAIIATFNNDPRRRILICNIEVGGVGISLQDKKGNSPRFMFISPSYKMLSIHQATGRIYRKGVRSNATTRIVNGYLGGLEEEKVKNALARKSEILRRALINKDVLLPDEYPDYIEPVKKGGIKLLKNNDSDSDSDSDNDSIDDLESDGEDAYLDIEDSFLENDS